MWATGYYGYLTDYLLGWLCVFSVLAHTWCFFRFVPRKGARAAGLILGNSLVALSILSVVAMTMESYLRFLSTSTDTFGATLTCKRWKAVYAPTNSLEHRDREWTTSKPAGVRRIAFVGDSFTYGWGIDDPANRFTDIVQRKFDQRSPGTVEVMNVAWGAWDTRAQSRHLNIILRDYDVDEVVLCYLPNDIEKTLPLPADHDPTKPPKPVLFRTESSFLLDYLFYRVYAPRISRGFDYFDWVADGFASETVWREHQNDLGSIIQQCREKNATFRAVLLPFILTGGTRFDARAVHQRLRNFFELNHVPVADLLPVIEGRNPKNLVVNGHDAHPNELANELFAEAIWKAFYEDKRRPHD